MLMTEWSVEQSKEKKKKRSIGMSKNVRKRKEVYKRGKEKQYRTLEENMRHGNIQEVQECGRKKNARMFYSNQARKRPEKAVQLWERRKETDAKGKTY